ncbi:hypothetical protein [Cohnella cellulosilytica]|uniref:Uncharacterized protein n=1 Tax=Cohnella cellulosilytica TaxID=986710 RepID=A0ABW2FKE4_9BACL
MPVASVKARMPDELSAEALAVADASSTDGAALFASEPPLLPTFSFPHADVKADSSNSKNKPPNNGLLYFMLDLSPFNDNDHDNDYHYHQESVQQKQSPVYPRFGQDCARSWPICS